MRKKIVSIIIASAMLLAMAGCGNKAAEAPAEVQEEQVAEVEAEAEEGEAEVEVAADDTQEAAEVAAAEEEQTAPEEDAAAVEEERQEGALEEEEAEAEDEQDAEAEAETEEVADATEEAEADAKEEAEAKAEEEKPAVTIPDWFDATYYAANNSDVVAAVGSSAEALYNHYTAHGKSEGRAAYEGDPNATARVADNQTEGTTQEGQGSSEGSGTSSSDDGCPWPLWQIMGSGADAYFYAPAYWQCSDEEKALKDALDLAMSEGTGWTDRGCTWVLVGEYNGRQIHKWTMFF